MRFPQFAPRGVKVIETAGAVAQEEGWQYVGSDHLLIGLIRSGGVPARVLEKAGVTEDEIRRAMRGTSERVNAYAHEIIHREDPPDDPLIDLLVDAPTEPAHVDERTERLLLAKLVQLADEGKGTWTACMVLLERLYPSKYRRRYSPQSFDPEMQSKREEQ